MRTAVLRRQNFFCRLKTSGSKAFEQLSEVQRRRLLMLAEGVSLREIARQGGQGYQVHPGIHEGGQKKVLEYFSEIPPQNSLPNLRMLKDIPIPSFQKAEVMR